MEIDFGSNDYNRHYNEAESEQLFLPIVDKIFLPHDDLGAIFHTPSKGACLFRNPDWKLLAINAYAWGGVRDYVPPDMPKGAAQYLSLSDSWDPMRPVWMALAEIGVDELIHMDPMNPVTGKGRAYTGAITSFPVSKAVEFIAGIYPGPIATFGKGCIFSRDGAWGIYSQEDICSIIGGEPELMNRIIELGGGEAFLKSDFDTIWHGRMYRMNPTFHRCAMNIYAYVGWEPPEFLRSWKP